jgi:hypothetical protein
MHLAVTLPIGWPHTCVAMFLPLLFVSNRPAWRDSTAAADFLMPKEEAPLEAGGRSKRILFQIVFS